ncbi:MAG: Sigma-70 region 2 [Proteobacteria bacterium]|uniref:Sigma-70 region 2 n=1 Tax=Dechloromonas aromatica (strain RCB) TaxID=159087 RepID=Q47F03_DECAR|nr:Sigma-70 region 2 [Pseudomonadota bacterium]
MSSAITTLYIEHIGELRRFLVRRLACIEVAAELAHETFVRYLVAVPTAPVANQRAFLFRIAGNLAIDYLRSHRLSTPQTVDLESCSDLPSDEPGPERYAIARQQLDCLRRAIDELPAKCREVFVRHKFDGISQKALASEYGVTVNAIEKHLVRALVFLRFRVMPA